MKWEFDRNAYSPPVAELLVEDRLPELGPGFPNDAIQSTLKSLATAGLFEQHQIGDDEMARCCLAGLWLHHDFLDESHSISQEIETPTASYWHAIMHRREPDAGNSKYWWRRVGSHPVLELLRQYSPAIGYPFSTPQQFVDLCERVRGSKSPEEDLARRVQLLEWQCLFDWCWRQAIGK